MAREPRALLLLLTLAVLGHTARLLLQPRASPPGQLLARVVSPPLDPARQHARAEQVARPLRRGERIDLNAAPAEEIARLPRIGMSLAKRIVADRSARGPFRGPEQLDRVAGIGPGLIRAVADQVRFSGVEAALPASGTEAANARSSGVNSGRPGPFPDRPIDLNSASEADLLALPGIGKARARAILAYRRDNGPFALVFDLGRVPGISQALAARLAPLLTAR